MWCAPTPVLDPGVCTVTRCEMGQASDLAVGSEGLKPPLDVVGENAAARRGGAFTAHHDPHPGQRPGAGEITEHAGQLRDTSTLARAAVGVDRLLPLPRGQGEDLPLCSVVPYAPYRRGPVSAAVCVVVALAALVLGIAQLAHHHIVRGGVALAAVVAAIILAVLSRRE